MTLQPLLNICAHMTADTFRSPYSHTHPSCPVHDLALDFKQE